jgi:RNA polymerase sigma-70 factor (ECF subfamily)
LTRDFRGFFESHYGPIYGFFRKRGFDDEDAKDLAQETFVHAYRARDSFRGEASPSTWLYTIAANIFRNEIGRRKAQKRSGKEIAIDSFLAEELPVSAAGATGGGGPLARLLEEEERRNLRRRIDDLPAQMRRCVLLRLDQELTYREIAVVLRLSVDTVKAHLFQARRRLKDWVRDDRGEVD